MKTLVLIATLFALTALSGDKKQELPVSDVQIVISDEVAKDWIVVDTITIPEFGQFKLELSTDTYDSIIFECGDNGDIRISMKAGNVEFNNCTPNEASMCFWKLVMENFAGSKKDYCKE